MTNSMKIAIAGSAGRMGRQLIAAAVQAGHEISGVWELKVGGHISGGVNSPVGRL